MNIKITANSTFHGDGLSQTFVLPAEEGVYYRRCKSPCDGKKKDGIMIHCGCGYPVKRTDWIVPVGWVLEVEWDDAWGHADHGKNNICIRLFRDAQ